MAGRHSQFPQRKQPVRRHPSSMGLSLDHLPLRVWSLQILLASFRTHCGPGLTAFCGELGVGCLQKELASLALGHKPS